MKHATFARAKARPRRPEGASTAAAPPAPAARPSEWLRRATSLLLCAILAVGLLPTLSPRQGEAHADTAQTVSGQAYVHCVNPGHTNDHGNLFDVTMPDGTVLRGHCLDYGLAYPADGWYSFSGTWNGSSFDIVVNTRDASPHPDCLLSGPCQRVGNFSWSPEVSVSFAKESADASITTGNAEYAYSGASYDIYDASDDSLAAQIVTGEDGKASCKLPANKSYYAIERQAPDGFKPSGERVYFETGMGDGQVRLEDEPCTVAFAIRKRDSATGGEAQPGATLSGARYKLVDANGASHVATSDDEGIIRFDGIPLGDATLVEIEPPKGYRPDPEPHQFHVSGSGQHEDVLLEPSVDEDVIAFDIEIAKFKDYGDFESGVAQPAAGVVFEIVSNTTQEVVGTVETNQYGFANTASNPDAWFGEGSRPDGASGAIPYDEAGYTVREVEETVPDGFHHVGDWTVTEDDMQDGALLQYIVDNAAIHTRIQIVKTDAVTGRAVPVAGFSFQLLDEGGNPIVQESWYPNHVELSEFTTDETGCVTLPEPIEPGTYYVRETAAQPPYLLGGEDVRVVVPDDEAITPTVVVRYADEAAEGSATIRKTDAATGEPMAGAEFDVVSLGLVKGPDGTVQLVEGETVGSVTTGADGTASIDGLPLGTGSASYAFVETRAPEGYVLDPTPREFTVSYQDQNTSVAHTSVDAENRANTLTVAKTELGNAEASLPGTEFLWWNADQEASFSEPGVVAVRAEGPGGWVAVGSDETEHPMSYDEDRDVWWAGGLADGDYEFEADGKRAEGTLTVAAGGTAFGIASAKARPSGEGTALSGGADAEDEAGPAATEVLVVEARPYLILPGEEQQIIEVAADGALHVEKLAPGTYRLQEAEPVPGYVRDETVRSVTVGEDGAISGEWLESEGGDAAAVLENDYTKVDISKRSVAGEDEIPGAHLKLEDADGTVVEEWVSGDEPHRVERLEPGDYTLTETMTPNGYDQAQSVSFTVEETGEVQRVVMYDEPISVSGEIDKRQEIADPTAPGAVENGDGANKADVSVSEDGRFDYSLDYRSTSSTWVDEFTVTDDLSSVEKGLAVLEGVTTAQAVGDRDGRMNVWYRTNLTPSDHVDESGANATLDDGHGNPWLAEDPNGILGDDGRAVDYAGWRLWESGVDATRATDLDASDLGLGDGEVVTAVRFEYGCVDAGFTTREDGWDREGIKDAHDDVADAEPANGDSPSAAILHMRVTDSYAEGALLENETRVDLCRNGGGDGLEGHDSDRVEQVPGAEGPALPDTGDAAAAALPWLAAACGVGAAAAAASGALRLRRERKGKADAGQAPEGAEEA